MGQLYTAGVDGLATGTALKTILQIATPSTVRAKITSLDVTFDGVTSTNIPVLVSLRRQTSGGTGSASLASNFGPNPLNPDAPTANVTATQGPAGTWTAEPTTGKVLKVWRISPTAGITYQLPLGQEFEMAVSQYMGVVVTAGAAVNCSVSISWDE